MNRKILIIDGHPVYIHKLESFFEGLAYKNIQLAKSGKEGLAKAESFRPDLILLSGMLADMESHEVCRRVKEILNSVRVIVQTGFLTEEAGIAKFKELGADAVLPRKEKDWAPLQEAALRLTAA